MSGAIGGMRDTRSIDRVVDAVADSADGSTDMPFRGDVFKLQRDALAHLEKAPDECVAQFDGELAMRSGPAAILSCLSRAECASLRAKHAAHLRFLLHPDTSRAAIAAAARAIGTRHALAGVSAAWVAEAMGMYRGVLRRCIGAASVSARDRHRLVDYAEARLQLDLQGALDAMHDVTDAYNAFVARPITMSTAICADALQAELDACAELPGMRACLWLRPKFRSTTAAPEFVLEISAGQSAGEHCQLGRGLQEAGIADPCTGGVRDMVRRAWIGGDIEVVDHGVCAAAGRCQDALGPERRAGSWVAIPVKVGDEADAILVLHGAYARQFSSLWVRTFVMSLQNRMNHLTAMVHVPARAIERETASMMRNLLYAGGLRMVFQPIFDLGRGTIRKIEALARLDAGHGRPMIGPDRFLPAFRQADLDALFRDGLRQSLQALKRVREHAGDVDVSINVSPSTLQHPECADWIRDILRSCAVEPARVVLELLESQAFDARARSSSIQRIADLGVQLAIDDLGSGYSSLQRLTTMPFDVIKIDQSIVREMQRAALKTFSLVRTIVEFGRDFDKEVIVEGVEDEEMIEVVRILGVRYAQGYAICKPAAVEQLVSWVHGLHERIASPPGIRSTLAALAFAWKFRHAAAYRIRVDVDDCPLHGFFMQRGLRGSDVDLWHRQSHAAAEPAQRERASRAVRDWLSERVAESIAAASI